MINEIIRLAKEYTQETADLKDYQCLAKSAIFGRQKARVWMENDGCTNARCSDLQYFQKEIPVEECDPDDQTNYIWALVPEYNSHKQAKVVLRRVGTTDGELLLPPEERGEKRLKMTEKEESAWRVKILRSTLDKIKNYESQIKMERGRLKEQIKNDDKAYMEACAIQLKRICDNMQEDLDNFLDLLV